MVDFYKLSPGRNESINFPYIALKYDVSVLSFHIKRGSVKVLEFQEGSCCVRTAFLPQRGWYGGPLDFACRQSL